MALACFQVNSRNERAKHSRICRDPLAPTSRCADVLRDDMSRRLYGEVMGQPCELVVGQAVRTRRLGPVRENPFRRAREGG
jgi:hypothetical protein